MTVFLHIGLHKTGSTGLQRFFAREEAALAAAGIRFPKAGRAKVREQIIHSNLGWEYLGHDSFDPALGTLKDMEAEIAADPGADWILSNEGFSRIKDTAEFLSQRSIGPVEIVAFSRERASLAPSLYTEQLKMRLAKTFCEWIADAAETGPRRLVGIDLLDQDVLVNCWRETGVPVHEIPLADLAGADVTKAFFAAIGRSPPGVTLSAPMANVRISTAEAAAMCGLNAGLRLLDERPDVANYKTLSSKLRTAIRRDDALPSEPFVLTASERSALGVPSAGAPDERDATLSEPLHAHVLKAIAASPFDPDPSRLSTRVERRIAAFLGGK
ncbi:hypothetical protein [Jannaschia aquimarina]|uniref:Sulfotransferase family protein n=1 Tax=Jannaschia aquimarina TaxID=935700 RepID=A0A0D1EGS2_9RHOB|nr:hypothetical protein [Jannaschia aquimarina]KIT16804.1 hypothetical protein jaqu_12990 [Jannaschia aquimarina]SNT13843.1 hypothetical protein SAMN05421775_106148 [Jannaschia aquimarina]